MSHVSRPVSHILHLTSHVSRFTSRIAVIVNVLMITACGTKPDVSVKIDRMEQTLFALPTAAIPEAVPQLRQRYGQLLDLYSEHVIGIGSPSDTAYPAALAHFLTDTHINLVCRRVQEIFPDLSDLETDLSKAFSNYSKAFPQKPIPSVYTLLSGFNQQMITADTLLAIALDNYLGKNEPLYRRLDRAVYQRQAMDAQYLLPDCMKAWIYTEFPLDDPAATVLANIIYEGKVMYAVRRMLPQIADSLILGYTTAQMEWCRNNTAQMWTFMVEKKMLFLTDYLTISKLVGPAPFTSLFTRESPGRAAVWLGYQIVDAYMRRNRVSLEQLFAETDYQQMLVKAKFRP